MKVLLIIITILALILILIAIVSANVSKQDNFNYVDEAEDEHLKGWKQRVTEQQMYEDGIRNW